MRYLIVLLLLAGCDSEGRYQPFAARYSAKEEERIWIVDTKTGRVSMCYTVDRVICTRWADSMHAAEVGR